MVHPKLVSVTRRSLLAATAAAMMAGPLAVAGTAQTLDAITDSTSGVLDLTCKEAKATEDNALIKEFCDTDSGTTSTVTKTVKDADSTVTTTKKTVEKSTSDDGGSSDGGSTVTDPVSQPSKQQPSGGTEYRAVSDKDSSKKQSRGKAANSGSSQASGAPGFNADGPFMPGMRSHSQLTLQPFAAPLVSVPPIYELPQIAQQLFGSTGPAGAEDPLAADSAATQASPYTAAGYTATPADPAGWLAATATGLIMLVGAGHALTGGRVPSRKRA